MAHKKKRITGKGLVNIEYKEEHLGTESYNKEQKARKNDNRRI